MRLFLLIPFIYVSVASATNTSEVEPSLNTFKQEREYLVKVAGVATHHKAFLNCPQLIENKDALLDLVDKIKDGESVSRDSHISSLASFGQVKKEYDPVALEAERLHSKITFHLPWGLRLARHKGHKPNCAELSVAISNSLVKFYDNYLDLRRSYSGYFKLKYTPLTNEKQPVEEQSPVINEVASAEQASG